jgi:tRNA(Ile)-lysidine synthase
MKEFSLSLDKSKKYLLGLSGGADSVCLFHLLRLGGYHFAAAHINHNIRGDEAKRDEDFCRELCREHGIGFYLQSLDVPALAKEFGESLEEAARHVRYDFFEEVMRAEGIEVLLTAHNADDNAETLLLSLTRGCTLSGACGIAPRRTLPFGVVERPLLGFAKKDIVEFCNERAFAFVSDRTNADTSYPRNRIRNNILPELEAINPAFLTAFARFTESARLDSDYLDAEAEKYANELDCSALSAIPYPIASRAIAMGAYRAGAEPEAFHIEKMIEMAKAGGGSISLPGSICAECVDGKITFRPDTREKKSSAYPNFEPIALKTGENELYQGKLILVNGNGTNDSAQVYNFSTSAIINADKIKGQLYARARREGDRILICGMHKSIKKLISEKASHLELSKRRALPVICHGEEIVWVPFLPVADGWEGKTSNFYYCID